MVVDFEIYQGENTNLKCRELGLGPSVVLRLVESLPANSYVFFDRYFTTLPLLDKLSEEHIEGTGTIMLNRLREVGAVKDDNIKLKRGESVEYVRSDNKIVVLEWMDNNKVTLASTWCGIEPQEKVTRWSKSDKGFIEITCPSAIKKYNQCMGGVDLCDQLIECYRTLFKTKKWTVKCILHFLDLVVVNSWMRYMREAKSNKIAKRKCKDLLQFRMDLAEALLSTSERGRKVLSDSEEEPEVSVKRSKFSIDLESYPVMIKDMMAMNTV